VQVTFPTAFNKRKIAVLIIINVGHTYEAVIHSKRSPPGRLKCKCVHFAECVRSRVQTLTRSWQTLE